MSNTTGTVLDPIFSLRRRVVIEPGRRVQLSFVTAVADNRTYSYSAYREIQRHRSKSSCYRTSLELCPVGVSPFAHSSRRSTTLSKTCQSAYLSPCSIPLAKDRLRKNRLGQSGLWAQGISGDLPIVVVTVGDIYDVDLVKQLLIAHAFWSLRGLKVDLIIFNEEETGIYATFARTLAEPSSSPFLP